MAGEVAQGDEPLVADSALERTLTTVQQTVPFQVTFMPEELAAFSALVGFLTGVHQDVTVQISGTAEEFLTFAALVEFLARLSRECPEIQLGQQVTF